MATARLARCGYHHRRYPAVTVTSLLAKPSSVNLYRGRGRGRGRFGSV